MCSGSLCVARHRAPRGVPGLHHQWSTPVQDLLQSVPVLDLSRPEAEVAPLLHKACVESGFFYVTRHGIPEELLEAMFDRSRAFFALPMDAKMAIHINKHNRGYTKVALQPAGTLQHSSQAAALQWHGQQQTLWAALEPWPGTHSWARTAPHQTMCQAAGPAGWRAADGSHHVGCAVRSWTRRRWTRPSSASQTPRRASTSGAPKTPGWIPARPLNPVAAKSARASTSTRLFGPAVSAERPGLLLHLLGLPGCPMHLAARAGS